jgi:hypothetical protein
MQGSWPAVAEHNLQAVQYCVETAEIAADGATHLQHFLQHQQERHSKTHSSASACMLFKTSGQDSAKSPTKLNLTMGALLNIAGQQLLKVYAVEVGILLACICHDPAQNLLLCPAADCPGRACPAADCPGNACNPHWRH